MRNDKFNENNDVVANMTALVVDAICSPEIALVKVVIVC